MPCERYIGRLRAAREQREAMDEREVARIKEILLGIYQDELAVEVLVAGHDHPNFEQGIERLTDAIPYIQQDSWLAAQHREAIEAPLEPLYTHLLRHREDRA